jgi:hypothetical protein
MKNRMRESCESGSVRGEDGNVLTYSAVSGSTQAQALARNIMLW